MPKTTPTCASPNPPEHTKIRVRTDLMHQLGLMSNTGNTVLLICLYFRISLKFSNFADPNAVNRNPTVTASAAKKKNSYNIDHLVSSSSSSRTPQPKVIAPHPPPRSSNLLQLLIRNLHLNLPCIFMVPIASTLQLIPNLTSSNHHPSTILSPLSTA